MIVLHCLENLDLGLAEELGDTTFPLTYTKSKPHQARNTIYMYHTLCNDGFSITKLT